MFKTTVFCTAVVMLFCGAALATTIECPIGFKLQLEDFTIGAINLVGIDGSVGSVTNGNTAMIIQNQCDWKICSNGQQDELVIFGQDGKICGICGGTWLIGQEALVGGTQMQLIGDGCDSKIQMQNLGVGLGQEVTKIDGSGAAIATHELASVQSQHAQNSAGAMDQSNVVLAGQLSSVMGGPCTTGLVTSGLTVSTSQTQMDL